MANRMVYPLQGVSSPGVIFLPFLFYPNGTSVSALVVAPAFASTSTSNAFIASVIRTSTAGQFTITLRDSYVQYLGGNAQIHLNTPATDLKAIREVEDEFLKTYPSLIPIKEAHNLKKGTYAVLGDKAYTGELKSADLEAQKALAGGLRAETEKGAPAIVPINKEQSDLINAVKAAISRDAIAGRKDPLSLGALASHPIAAIAFMANRSEIVKSLLARAIYSSADTATAGVGAVAGAGINAAQAAQMRQKQ